ncbi:MAG: hypothetical protein ABEH43_09310, partial [Flavobacteriales bacterium]
IFTVFRNNTAKALIHNPIFLKPMHLDETSFTSIYGMNIGEIDLRKNETKKNKKSSIPDLDLPFIKYKNIEDINKNIDRVVTVKPTYPGINFKQVGANLPANSIIIVKAYHSGTLRSGNREEDLISLLKRRDDLKVIICSVPSKIVSTPYESTKKLSNNGAIILEDIPWHVPYVYSQIATHIDLSTKKIIQEIKSFDSIFD